ncbi:two component transcriptional regulator, LytTR family [Mucilaginibacter sp. OK283]|jgi:DNA-binding LytR/AlgR family response regulator|uniref:Response regulator transcription factor n=2 Tax=Sphingobacteriaceae TaxID=84566 RepID=A0A5B8W9A4_9SPHI|nr:response regulator transcription factor [Mucilaginibacter ginsenosidivorax]SEP14549.1 two component transcriptional regulator, LytTR family [Mucilaginibacter sp. OK283]
MRCLIIDDEPLALDLLEDNLKHVHSIQIAARCRNAGEAILAMQKEQIDLIFCDIYMPGINGLQLIKSLTQRPMVIFVTAYEKFALEGFELDVIDYLVKPVPLDRFLKACHKAIDLFELRRSYVPQPVVKNYFFLHADYNLIKISFDQVEYIEGLKDYVKVHFTNQQKPVLSRISLKAVELQLPAEQFFRVHKSFVVNLQHVSQLRRARIKLINTEVPLSDSYREVINKMIGKV